MPIDLIITIMFCSIIQSIFGTGVLLFGTPLLLILDYDFQKILFTLLPISILINLFQIKSDFKEINFIFLKKVLVFSIPFIVIIIYFFNYNLTDINLLIGVFLVIISLKEKNVIVKKLIKILFKYENIFLIIMGIIHGLTNLGGALLSAMVFNKNLSKKGKRATVSICYLTFALFQLSTMTILFNKSDILIGYNSLYWGLGLIMFYLTEKYIYFKIKEENYVIYSNLFLLMIGIILIIKN